jgi:hypothetical protein
MNRVTCRAVALVVVCCCWLGVNIVGKNRLKKVGEWVSRVSE